MQDFEIKKKQELKKMPLEELEAYYRDFRKYQYQQGLPIEGIEKCKKNYPMVRKFLMADKLMHLRTVKLVKDQRISTKRPKIYACTHIGRYDVESALELIGEDAWVLMGDPGETYRNLDGKILEKLGVIYFDTDRKFAEDRHIALETCIKVLKQGGNIIFFPEGAWSLETVIPTMKLFSGVVEMSIRGDADIIPIGIEQYREKLLRHYYVNIGKNLYFPDGNLNNKEQIAEIVRWKMADLKWEIWEKYGKRERKSIPNNWEEAKEEFIESIMRDTENGYTIEEIERTKFHDQTKPQTPDEVFSYLNRIQITSKNAFLAKDIYKYQQRTSKQLKKTI